MPFRVQGAEKKIRNKISPAWRPFEMTYVSYTLGADFKCVPSIIRTQRDSGCPVPCALSLAPLTPFL